MNYKGYTFNLSGVYKIDNNRKLYSLEIYKNATQIFKSDWIYDNEKKAFKDAKNMINKNKFDTEIIRENTNKENFKNDKVYKNKVINSVSNSIIIFSIIFMIIAYVATAFGIKELNEDITLFGILYVSFGIFISLIMLYWGILSNGGFELNDNQRKVYSIIWWVNLLFNKGPVISYNEQPFKNTKKGWYSSTALITLIFEAFFGIFIILACTTANSFNLLFYATIISYILLFINYIFSVVWEISNAKISGEDFPFKRVVTPILTIAIIAIFVCLYIKIF